MADEQIEQAISAQVLSLHDGDLLVLSYPGSLTKEQWDRIQAIARKVLDRAAVKAEVLALSGGLTIEQVSAADLRRLLNRDAEGQP